MLSSWNNVIEWWIFLAIVYNFDFMSSGIIELLIAPMAWCEFFNNSLLVIDLEIHFSIVVFIKLSFSCFICTFSSSLFLSLSDNNSLYFASKLFLFFNFSSKNFDLARSTNFLNMPNALAFFYVKFVNQHFDH